jgi:hypothetical protein
MTIDRAHLDGIDHLLRRTLGLVEEQITDRNRTDVLDYLDHGEYGVAYELLIFILDNQQISRPSLLRDVGKRMGMTD